MSGADARAHAAAAGASGADALGLAAALAERGMGCVVEARERLAVLVASGEWPALAEAAERRVLHRLAVAHGFTHVALELDDDGASDDAGDGAGDGTAA